MNIKDEERAKVYSSSISELEKKLSLIEKEELKLLKEFDSSIREILGTELLEKIGYDFESDFLINFHKSFIDDKELKEEFVQKLSFWFKEKTAILKDNILGKNTFREVNKCLPQAYALASLALTCFHQRPNMRLYEVQKLTGIAISNGNIAELGTGEGKTLSAVLPVFLQALRGKGVHVVTSNGYLSKRDFEEVKVIFEGLGVSVGYTPESVEDLALIEGINPNSLTDEKRHEINKRLIKIKQDAYSKDITYGSKTAFAFDYLKDSVASNKEDIVQRKENPGFALIDEVDDALIDDAECPYVLGGNLPMYVPNMDLKRLSMLLNVPYDDIKIKMNDAGMSISPQEKVNYEEARYISTNFYSKELMPDLYSFQKRVQRFIEQKINADSIYIMKDIRFPGASFEIKKEDFYEALTIEDECPYYIDGNEHNNQILNDEYNKGKNASIICYLEKGEYKISDLCYKEFLDYCYHAFQIRDVTLRNETEIIDDPNYREKIDYNFVNGCLVLTYEGAKKIVVDNNHPNFSEDYDMYMNLIRLHSSEMLNYLNQAIIANFFMKKNEDYTIQNGVLKVVGSGRIQDGSTYTDGLQQALEFKEKIEYDKMTKDNLTIATITQKDFYSRYDGFSGMTGTSSKRVFSEVFNKDTTVIPRNAFYKFYSKYLRKRKRNSVLEPEGVMKSETLFTIDENDKIDLIVNSILESLKKEPSQPVLVVVANPDEMGLISNKLKSINVSHSLLDANTEKSNEAMIIAKAGLPGNVTISTEMAGRGTDIKLGGDRETIIDIATERHIRKVEEKLGQVLQLSSSERENTRKIVEESILRRVDRNLLWTADEEKTMRESLEMNGLKVISSGYFKIDRIDRQLEGRTGRNGSAGECERFACPSDLEYIGVEHIEHKKSVHEYFKGFPTRDDGAIIFDERAKNKIDKRIKSVQLNNEAIISQSILSTQNVSRNSTKLMEKYREERRNIIYSEDSLEYKVKNMIERTVDNLLVSYMIDGVISRNSLLSELNSSKFKIDLETFLLDVKNVFGLQLDEQSIVGAELNVLELRQAVIDASFSRYEEKRGDNIEKDKEVLLLSNDFSISMLPSILDSSNNQMFLTSISMGIEDQAKYMASYEFYRKFRQMELEADKYAIKSVMGVTLTKEEQTCFDERKYELFGQKIDKDSDGYEVRDSIYVENDGEILDTFRDVAVPVINENTLRVDKIERKIKKKENVDIEKLYSNLSVRPFKFVDSLSENDSLILVSGIPSIGTKKHSK